MHRRDKDRRRRGQSLVEFALIVPVLLTLVGAALDVARVYFTWANLEAATRDAAQYVATDPAYTTTGGYYDATDTTQYCATPPFSTPCTGPPTTDARFVLEKEIGTTFTKSSAQTECDTPTVWATVVTSTSISDGGSSGYPMATAKVTTCTRFRALFAYPFFTQGGDWILRVERTYKVLVGR